mmetsp:Transcript_91679/g.259532  ORF Transcript_91679/g.259532 Transcript_91679/m.259532 type:complete len:242 (+) Transcript_91679:342-1067(+)
MAWPSWRISRAALSPASRHRRSKTCKCTGHHSFRGSGYPTRHTPFAPPLEGPAFAAVSWSPPCCCSPASAPRPSPTPGYWHQRVWLAQAHRLRHRTIPRVRQGRLAHLWQSRSRPHRRWLQAWSSHRPSTSRIPRPLAWCQLLLPLRLLRQHCPLQESPLSTHRFRGASRRSAPGGLPLFSSTARSLPAIPCCSRQPRQQPVSPRPRLFWHLPVMPPILGVQLQALRFPRAILRVSLWLPQ